MAALRGRQTCIKILDKHLNSDNERSVGAALILGFKDEIPQEVLTAYINTGSMHVLSVSGLHVGVVAIMLELLLKKISTRRRWWRVTKPIVLIFFIWVFSIFTGASAAVLRAAVMFSFLILGRSLRREVNIYNILAISAFVLLCYNPFLLMDVGFQLSYMALVGIVYFQPKIYRMWLIDNKLGDYLWSLTATGIAATLATLPISLYFFHQFPTYFWLSGFVVVPAAVVILWLGIALFCFDWIPFVGIIIGKLLYYGIWITNALLFLIQKLPYSVVTGIFISMAALIFLYLALLSTSLAILTKRFRWVLVGLGCLVPVLGMRAYQAFRSVESKKIIIYNTYKNSIIDCISSGSCRSFQSSGLLPKTELFATQNARWEAGVSNGSIEKFIFTDSLIERNDLLYKNNFISFCDKKIYFLNAPLIADSSRKINIDYLVVSKNSMLQIKEIKKYFDASLVILDASNTAYKAKKLAAECQLIGQPCWDMSEQPAFVTYCK